MRHETKKYDVGVIVGRFQVPELHEGHRDLIQHVSQKHQKTIIFLGTSPLWASSNNPLDFQARRQMLNEFAPAVEVLYVKDVNDDDLWSKRLDTQIQDHLTPSQNVVLYGARDSFIRHYTGKFDTQVLEAEKILSGTAVRAQVKAAATRGSADFRAGVIWATGARYPTTYPTVDVAILSEDRKKVLLARKPDEKLWRFVGGFADPRSDSYEADALREVREETGLEVSNLTYIGSTTVDDWRYRSEPDKIKTMLYTATYTFGHPQAQDDIAEVKWFDISNGPSLRLQFKDMVLEHHPLLGMLYNYLKKDS